MNDFQLKKNKKQWVLHCTGDVVETFTSIHYSQYKIKTCCGVIT